MNQDCFWEATFNSGWIYLSDKMIKTDMGYKKTNDFLRDYNIQETLLLGSSYKFCLLACGKADIYPRLSPTCEWDIAAGHAILKAAGGNIYTLDGDELRYGHKDNNFINPHFLARHY